MCGRFALFATMKELVEAFGEAALPDGYAPSWNVAPGTPILALARRETGFAWERLGWGLVPAFAKRAGEGPRPINARSETAATSPAFRGPFRRGRVAVPMSGFYEWRKEGRAKVPYFFSREDGRPFAVAALADRWRDPAAGGSLATCALLTTAANPLVARLHDRMPAILDPAALERWLDPAAAPESLLPLLAPAPVAGWRVHPVSPRVNAACAAGPALVEPAAAQGTLGEGD